MSDGQDDNDVEMAARRLVDFLAHENSKVLEAAARLAVLGGVGVGELGVRALPDGTLRLVVHDKFCPVHGDRPTYADAYHCFCAKSD